jgi:radical SAM superfamily enzyme YgiQ (UPF0313 family)
MRPLRIYLVDPTHTTILPVSDTIPINIGFIGSYAKQLYGEGIEVSLFKYPQKVIDALKVSPPDVLALSNYSWNSHLSERLAQFAKEINPHIITVQGGTNFPHEDPQCRQFLLRRPSTDLYVELEAEIAFSNLIARILETWDGGVGLFDRPIDGCMFIEPSTRSSKEPVVIKGIKPPRIHDLDAIPSPYLNGMLDHFFDEGLTPFIETNRGCPFKCSFCHTGNDYFQKTNMFSVERVREEIAYIAPRAAALGIVNLHIADTNFGMYPRDREICLALRETHETFRWPLQIMSTTGKNNKERVIDITGIMGTVFSVNMSVQSMDRQVLANIKRDNISLDHYIEINEHLKREGRSTKAELILGLPGETKESFLGGVEHVIESGVSTVTIYTLMLLNGTEFQNPGYRTKFGIVGKFRIVPLDFGEYEGVRVFDHEEVAVQTKDMSFDDYLYVRGFALLIETLHNGRPFEELFRHVITLGVSRTMLLRRAYERLGRAPREVQKLMGEFLKETRRELWDSEQQLVAHYQQDENYQRLLHGEVGGNLIYKYKSISLVYTAEPWLSFLVDLCKELAAESLKDPAAVERAKQQIDVLGEFCRKKLDGLLDPQGDVDSVYMESPYDIFGWLQSDDGIPLGNYACTVPVHYEFFYTADQLWSRSDLFKRYGTSVNAASKIVTRVSSLESLMRKVRTAEGEQIIYADADVDRFTRYGLSR